MRQLTPEGQQKVTELAQRYGISTEAVLTLLQALVHGHGTMAQFDHRELGGRGQWMRGGMVMAGDMFNQALKATVVGMPAASGAQNAMRYAYFPGQHRLAIAVHEHLRIYDTLDHQVSGVSQQQGTGSRVTFTSQHGVVEVNTLPIIASARSESLDEGASASTSPAATPPPEPDVAAAQGTDIFATIERLAELRHKGILSEEEFAAKKAELLRRI